MITAETLRALLALVEEAKAGSRELDAELGWHLSAIGNIDRRMLRYAAKDGVLKALDATYTMGWRDIRREIVPPLTTSIDAALALVAKVLPGQNFALYSQGISEIQGEATALIRFERLTSVEESAATLPLAIIAAMLKAKRLQLLKQSETAHVER